MRAEDLMLLAAPRGIDLISAAQSETAGKKRSDVTVRQRFGQRVTILRAPVEGGPPEMHCHGKETRSMVEREWSIDELGQAAYGVPEVPFLAACFAWAGANQHYWRLHDELHKHALRFRRDNRWPAQVPGHDGVPRFYLEHLCSLVLDMDSQPALFIAGTRYADERAEEPISVQAIYLQVSETVWRNRLFDRYARIAQVWTGWLDQAARMMQSRLREEA